jgi:hypothetical protein
MKNVKPLDRNDAVTLLLLASVLFGGVFRLFPSILAGFPVNDGGMFYVMMKDLQANHYLPPLYTTYNHLNIPFAYPPLALYLGAGLSSLLGISLSDLLLWLPGLINTACIPAFYLLAREVLDDQLKGALATLVFALTPHLVDWLSMGGGLTRSLGTLFMLLTSLHAYRLFTRGGKADIGWTILFGSLTILSHTESTIFAISLPILFWIMKSRTLTGIKYGMLTALGVIVLSGPWYGLVISRHGIETILSALKTGGHAPWAFLHLLNIHNLTTETFLDLLGTLGILGMIILIARRQYIIPIMLVMIFLVERRSATTIANLPLAMAAGYFLEEIILPALHHRAALLLALTVPFLLMNPVSRGQQLSINHVPTEDRIAMTWAAGNTPADSRFLVLTGQPVAMCDSVGEWFPALTDRTSIATAQGREWIMGEKFVEFVDHRDKLQECINQGQTCLEERAKRLGADYDYIYVSTHIQINTCTDNGAPTVTNNLVNALSTSPDYQIIYQMDDITIFSRK